MSKKILITGVSGFLGSHLAKAFLGKGYDIVALKRKSSSLKRIKPILSRITLCDIEDLDFPEFFQSHSKIDAIIHTAACLGRKKETASQIFEANTAFPLRLLEAASSAGIDVFINTSTALDKNLNSYSLSKDQFTQWGRFYSMHYGTRFLNMRLEIIYGPEDDDSKFTNNIIKSCLANAPELKLTKGEQKRDFIYIDDVVFAYLILLEKIDSFSDLFMEYDVGSGNAVSIREVVETIHRLTKSQSQLAFGALPYRKGEEMLSQAEIEPLVNLGWSCKISLERGLQLTMDSF
jgi:CDP-paratose synthetase